jgi:choline kinase
MKAAILTSGTADHVEPTALVSVAGTPVLRRAITTLARVGVDELVIAGDARVREAAAAWGSDAELAFVDDFAAARPFLDGGPFLLLDDRVVFDVSVVELLLDRGLDAVAVRAVMARKGAVRVAADAEDHITAIGRDLPSRGTIGEPAGLAFLSADTGARLSGAPDVGGAIASHEAILGCAIDVGASLLAVDVGARPVHRIECYADLCRANARCA